MRASSPILSLLIAVLLLLAVAGCGDSPGKIDENIKKIDITPHKFVKGDTTVFLPEIAGMKNESLQKKINDNLKTAILDLERKGDKSGLEGEYGIIFLNDRLMVIAFDGANAIKDDNGNFEVLKGLHIDLTSGKIYEPTEIFKKDSKYEAEILNLAQSSPELRLYNAGNTEWPYGLFKSNWDSKKKNQFYMLTEDYLWVYTFSVDEEGLVPGYGIPYDKIKHIINTDSNLWKAFSSGENRAEDFGEVAELLEYQADVEAREKDAVQKAAAQKAAAQKAAAQPGISWKTTNVLGNGDGSITINGQYVNTSDKTLTKILWNKLTIYYRATSGEEKSFVKTFNKELVKEAPPGRAVSAWFRVNVPGDYKAFIRLNNQFRYNYTYSN